LNIPKKIKVGDKWYSVDVVESMKHKGHMGHIDYEAKTIEVSRKSNTTGRAYKECDVRDSFWHELVHAILKDMGHERLNRNEQFVSRFANRLSSAIDSARF
jgi:hypothetical protein